MGVSVIKKCIRDDNGTLSIVSHLGRFCEQENNTVIKIHDLGPRSQGSGQECLDSQLGFNNLFISAGAVGNEILTENSTGKVDCNNGGSNVANCSLVAINTGDDDGTPASSPEIQINPENDEQPVEPSLPGSSGCSPSSSSTITPSLDSFLSNHLSDGTKNGYKYAFNKFVAYCSKNNYSPTTCGPEVIAFYLKILFDEGCSYSSVNLARSAISKYHEGYNGDTAGSHKLVSTAVKAVFRMRPPLPKYKSTFDITLVLGYLKTLPSNDQLSLKQISIKALFLLIMSCISRVSSVARLGPDLLVYKVTY